jgi:hypothetical protein
LALDRLGIEATFRTDGRIEQLIAQLRLGFPIPATRQVFMHDPCGWMVEGVGSGGLPY